MFLMAESQLAAAIETLLKRFLSQILPRQQYSSNHRWLSFSAIRGRKIIIWLAVADLFASLGVFVRSSLWINFKNIMPAVKDDSSVLFCALSSVSFLNVEFFEVEVDVSAGVDTVFLHGHVDMDAVLCH